jgi:hypothetical protein
MWCQKYVVVTIEQPYGSTCRYVKVLFTKKLASHQGDKNDHYFQQLPLSAAENGSVFVTLILTTHEA